MATWPFIPATAISTPTPRSTTRRRAKSWSRATCEFIATTGLFVGDRAIYNVDTKEIRAVDMRTDKSPYLVGGENVTTISEGAFLVSKGTFTTHDSSNPDFRLKARTVRVYENDRVVFQNVTFYVKNVPIFWWPYMYQSLNDAFSYMVSPAYLSSWGPSLLTRVSMPITDDIKMQIRLDYRSRRGVAIGFEPDIRYGKDKTELGADCGPISCGTQIPISIARRRFASACPRTAIGFQSRDRTNFTEDIYGIVNITKLSDEFLLQDFYPGEFRIDPKPDNVVAVTKTHPIYTLTAIGRFQANDFFEATERLPEVVLDIKRTPLFGGPIFYEGETGIADLRRNFARDSGFQDYGTLRLDSFHQFLYPNTYFGWLSVVPRVGFRGTYYDETRDLGKTIFTSESQSVHSRFSPARSDPGDAAAERRQHVSNGVQRRRGSFLQDFARMGRGAKPRSLGLDGLRHIIQPFTNFSWVSSSELRSRLHPAVRSLPAFHAVAADRLSAIHHRRFDR